MTRQEYGMHLLRFSLAFVFLWFGFSQVIDSLSLVSIVPDWAVRFIPLPPAMIVMANGVFEIFLGSLLATGFFVRVVAFILGFHLFVIALSFGLEAIGVRDFGLSMASFSLSLFYSKPQKTLGDL